MSHFTRVKVAIRDDRRLTEALQEMGHEPVRNADVRGWMGQRTRANLVVRGANGYDIGFVRVDQDRDFEVVADWMLAGEEYGGRDGFIKRLTKEYAAAVTIAEVRKKGFQVVEREMTDSGQIRVRARRYVHAGA